MTSTRLIVVFSAVPLYAIWRLVRMVLARSPLDNIPGPPPTSRLTGNMRDFMSFDNVAFNRKLVETYGSVCRLTSFLGMKALLVHDTRALHTIYVKDQEIFSRDNLQTTGTMLLLGPGLLATAGAVHRRQRKMLNPVFSAAYMRGLTPFFYEIVSRLESAIDVRVRAGAESLDMAGWMGRTALELVGQGALGHSFDPLTADSKDEFTEAVKSFVPSIADTLHAMAILPFVKYLGPAWFRRRLLDLWPDKRVQRLKYLVDMVYSRTSEILEAKRVAILKGDEALIGQIGEGRDVMSILLRENMSASEEDRLPEAELLAQMATFIVAGVDTTSNAMSHVLDMLCGHPEAQERLRNEILTARDQYGKEIPYDEITQLPYLDAVCRETLRLFPPVSFVSRQAQKNTVIPLAEPIRGQDGSILSELAIPNGTMIFANITACNTNKALWGEDALEWRPERWLEPFPRALEEARIPGIYQHQFTFIGGGYACIGFKFSQLEMKVVLSTLVAAFRFELSEKPFVWNTAGVAYPAAKTGDKNPEMYLKVSLASD